MPKFSTILLFGLIFLCKKLRREKVVYVSRFAHRGDMFPLGATSLLVESSGFQEAYTKACNNFAKYLPQHIGAMSAHHAKFHDFHVCFGFTGIKKLSFSMFPAQTWRPNFGISFPFLAWDLEIHPRTHMWFSTNFGALEHVLVVQIRIMHIKCQKTQIMYKKGQTNPK